MESVFASVIIYEKYLALVDIDHPILGKVKYPGLPFHMSESQPEIKRVAPQFGEHTEEVLLERGFSWEEIQKLREEQII